MTNKNDGTHSRHTIEFIQVLRGLAAVAVVILHAGWEHADHSKASSTVHVLSSGVAGVDLFFIISGFIMYCTIPRDGGGWSAAWQFAAKRFSRIWPPYAAWTLIFAAMVLYVPTAQIFRPALLLGDLVNSLLFLPTSRPFFPPAFTLPVLDVGWTLYYEAYFYAVLALCLCLGRWKWAAFTGWLALALVAIPLVRGASLINANVSPANNAALINTLTNPIMWEFAAGVAIGWIYQRGIRFPRTSMGVLASALALTYLVVHCAMVKQTQHGLSAVGLPIALVVLALALTPMPARGTWKPLLWLGKVSFSLYLAHIPVILVMDSILSIRFAPLPPTLLAAYIAAACVLSVMVAGVSYRVFEAGLSNRIRDVLLSRRAATAHDCADGLRPPRARSQAGED